MHRSKQLGLLGSGLVLIVLSNTRWGIGALAWLAPVPLLIYLRHTIGWRSRVAVALTVIAAWALAVLKIATEPMPPVMAVVFGIIIGCYFSLGYLAWDAASRHLPERWRALAFPAAMVSAEWLQCHTSSLGSWGSAAYTQTHFLPLLQIASLLGPAGVSFIVYGTAAALTEAIDPVNASSPRRSHALVAAVAVLALACVWGAARMAAPEPRATRMAAVVTDASFGPGPLPDRARLDAIDDSLFARTARAARAGARLVSWTEVATAVQPEDQAALIDRARHAARTHAIELVIAYAVPRPLPANPMRYENKYVWIHVDGSIAHEYRKHHPVPGEPAIAGDEPPVVARTPFGPATGALCYDFDFPDLARREARLGVGLVVLPSSDWRGIDPIHTEMARLRAIEGGYSILRTTRSGLSAGMDPQGRFRGASSSYATADRVLVVDLPTRPVETPYRSLGDVLAYLALIGLAALLTRSAARVLARRAHARGVAAGVGS